MIRSVDFLSQSDAEALAFREDLILVSITSPGALPARLDHHAPRLLQLEFHDCDEADIAQGFVPLSDEQAHLLLDAIDRWHALPLGYDLVVHCRAGISRSAAVALAVEACTGCAFPRRRIAGQANRLALVTLSAALGRPLAAPPLVEAAAP